MHQKIFSWSRFIDAVPNVTKKILQSPLVLGVLSSILKTNIILQNCLFILPAKGQVITFRMKMRMRMEEEEDFPRDLK